MMRTTLYAAALLLSAGAFAASTVVWADSPASAIVGIGSIGDTPASGASGSTTGTIASPGASPAVHPEELSVPNVAMALAAFGYDRITGISLKDAGFTAAAERAGRPARIRGRQIEDADRYMAPDDAALRRRLADLGYGAVGAIRRDGGLMSAEALHDGRPVTLHLDGRRRIAIAQRPTRTERYK